MNNPVGREPVTLTWTLFLWGYIVPMLLIGFAAVSSIAWGVRQHNQLADLKDAQLTNISLADSQLCETARENRQIISDVLHQVLSFPSLPKESKDMLRSDLPLAQSPDCRTLPTSRP